jgi:hypothetical protein
MIAYAKRDSFLPYCLPLISEDELNEVVRVIKSGWLKLALWCSDSSVNSPNTPGPAKR